MTRTIGLCGAAVLVGNVLTAGQSAPASLAAVADAMGARDLKAIEYSGSGYSFAYQQAPGPGEPWPLFVVDTYKVSIDYPTSSMRFESTRAQGEHPPRGGAGQPIAGNPKTIQFVSGRAAWPEAALGRVQPAPDTVADRLRRLWMPPHGVIKAALVNHASLSGRTIQFALQDLPIRVALGANHLVERIEYQVDSPVLGDVPIEVLYSDYGDYGGVKFPTRIIEKTDGYLTWDITVTDVRPNAAVGIAVPSGVTSTLATAPVSGPPKVEAEQIGPGVVPPLPQQGSPRLATNRGYAPRYWRAIARGASARRKNAILGPVWCSKIRR